MGSFKKKKKSFYESLKQEPAGNHVRPNDEKMFKRLIERVQCGVYIADERGVLFYANSALASMLGYQLKSDILERPLTDVLFGQPDSGKEFYDAMDELGLIRDFEIISKTPTGQEVFLIVTSHFIREGEGKIKGIEGIVYDRTKSKTMQEMIVKEKHKLEEILDLGEKVTLIHDLNALINFIVERVAGILEARVCSIMLVDKKDERLKIAGAFGLEENVIAEAAVLLGEEISGVVARDLKPVLVKNIEYDERFKRANRPRYQNQSFMVVPVTLGEELLGVINVADKITENALNKSFDEIDLKILLSIAREIAVSIDNVKVINDLNLQTVTDPLTRIYNYRKFSDSLEHEIRRFRRSKTNLCVMMLDLDDFKSYNDTYGHLEGDILLRGIGEILRKSLRDTDIVCRYAGDEFVIVLPDTDLNGVKESAVKVIKTVNEYPFKRKVSVSVGCAGYEQGLTSNELMAKADKALYEAKRKGKNQFYILE